MLYIFLLCLFSNITIIHLQTLLDLSWNFDEKTVYMSDMKTFTYTKQIHNYDRGYWYSANEFCAAEHGGTHFDAPYHFNESGWKVNDVPIDRLYVQGALIDLSKEHEKLGRDCMLTAQHMIDWQKRNGNFSHGTVLLVKFGRSKFWYDRSKYLDLSADNNNTTMNFPGLSKEAAQWIVDSNKFYGVGLDTPSIDPASSSDYIVHRTFSGANLYNMENVKLIDDLPEIGFDLIVAPMKIDGGTGAPLRLFAKLH